MKIQLNTYADLQQHMERLHVSMSASLNSLLVEIINDFESEQHADSEETIEIEINLAILQESYREHSGMLKNALRKFVRYPFLHTKKDGQIMRIVAAKNSFYLVFRKKLELLLSKESIVMIPVQEVPQSYLTQPYVLAHRLRKKGFIGLDYNFTRDSMIFTWQKPTTQEKQNERKQRPSLSPAG